MFRKCRTNCQADKFLWIRNNVFYYMVELPRKNGKRRYLCKSLHTTNYYEAKEKVKVMQDNIDTKNDEAKAYALAAKIIINKLVFEEHEEPIDTGGACLMMQKVKRISPKTDPDLIKAAIEVISKKLDISGLSVQDQKCLKLLAQYLSEYLIHNGIITKPASNSGSNLTIEQVMDAMLKKANNVKNVEKNRRNLITKMIEDVGLKLIDKYSRFYTKEVIQQMCENIKILHVTDSVKRNHAREIENLIKYANYMEPDIYKTNLLNLIPNFKKTKNSARNPHWPFTADELKQIFNPANDFFNTNPDIFWSVVIGLFLGSRTNAAITLQYADIVNIKGIDCIKFQDTHPIKQLKNDASRRTVPIPAQMLDLGFVDYVNKRKTKLKAKDTDFIFPHCQTKSGTYNNKFMTRGFIKYVNDIGITKNNPHKLDFHSLRKNASEQLEAVGVPETFINDICGWEGKGTRQQSYSNHDLIKIQEQADKLRYDFLQPEFDYWKKVMAKK